MAAVPSALVTGGELRVSAAPFTAAFEVRVESGLDSLLYGSI